MSAALERLPRELHPAAWWIWALGMATAATRTTNPLLLGAIIAVVAFVVSARRGDAPWSSGFRGYVVAALVVIAVRVALRTVLDGQYGEHVLLHLPELPLPSAAEGIRIGGPVSLEGLLAAFYDGLRLATLILCIGAANVLANPKRLLKSTPARFMRSECRSPSLSPSPLSSSRALAACAGLACCAAATRRGAHASTGRRARDDRRARSVDPASPRRWIHEATGAQSSRTHRVVCSAARSCSSGCAACAWACTGCSMRPRRQHSACQCSWSAARLRWAGLRSPDAACARLGTAPTPGGPPSGWSRRRGSPSPRGCSSPGMSIPTT